MHNPRRPCGAVLLSGVTAERDGAARLSRRDFFALNPVQLQLTLWSLPFDLLLIDGQGIMMDYTCANFSFSHFGFIGVSKYRDVVHVNTASYYFLGYLNIFHSELNQTIWNSATFEGAQGVNTDETDVGQTKGLQTYGSQLLIDFFTKYKNWHDNQLEGIESVFLFGLLKWSKSSSAISCK